MANEVVLLLAKRAGLEDIDDVAYFRKLRSAIDGGLAWLDGNVVVEEPRFDVYADMSDDLHVAARAPLQARVR